MSLSMALSGRAGSTRLRGRVDGGFEAPSRARLEGIAPFGKPVFILVADGPRGTLVLPREDRVLADAPPERIVEALAGVALGPDALRTIVSGCGFGGAAPPAEGRRFANGWVSAETGDSGVYLRSVGTTWEMAAATQPPLTVTYSDYASGRPSTVRIRAASSGTATADVTLHLSQIETNTILDPRTFDIRPDLPAKPIPVTLEELRRAGPLGGS
jgi:hypothetical protein